MTSSHLLTFGDLTLSDGSDETPAPEGADYWFSVVGEDFSTGDAEPIERTIRTLLQDGAVTVTDGQNNRTATFRIQVEADNSLGLARGEAALAAVIGTATTMTWTPLDGWSPASVFEVFTSSMAHIFDDLTELTANRRTYAVRLVCHPTVRSVDEIETAAFTVGGSTPLTPTTSTISAATATTGWTAVYGTLSDVGSMLQIQGSRSPRVAFANGSPVDLSVTPYVSLVMYRVHSTDDTRSAPLPSAPALLIDGVEAEFLASQPIAGSNESRYFWRAPAATGSTFDFLALFPTGDKLSDYTRLRFYSLQRTNTPPVAGTSRQKQRLLTVKGSARTQGALAVEHKTSALGSALVYTFPFNAASGYTPPLRPRRTSGGTTTSDAGLVSGARDNLDTSLYYEIPVSQLPSGTYLLMARVRSDVLGTLNVNWTAQLVIGGTATGPLMSGTTPITFTATSTWRIVTLARQMLPPADVPDDSSASVRITLVNAAPSGSNIDIDEGWLFNTTIGDLTWVECGTTSPPTAGGSSNRLWIIAPTTTRPRRTILRGFAADGTDAFSAGADTYAFGAHEFVPPTMAVFIVTSNALDTACALTHHPRWHSHAAL